ncbi:pyridoxamine 5'-phosphate oxidase family protein [Acetobacterium malicum]|uniref:pyridoxamine 5'-phosphate oxidase family protein n=1 Tax=Acetobacterium malicum TaxID=52692 RepID=UPI0003F94978|nr:pyridoxamine 5'-phosphate oxidase family protein [Acetobacterium dehalogenans]
MLAKLETILRENSLCVLCTEAAGNPYCSLMTYLSSDDLRVLYLVSTRESRKFKNLLANPRVSVLVDSRQHRGPTATENIVSVTFSGLFQPLADSETERVKTAFTREHPELTEILTHPDSVIFAIKLMSYLLLDGPVDADQGDL